MRGLFFLLASYVVLYATADEQVKKKSNIVDFIGQGIKKEIQTVKQPIDETLAFVGSSQCKHVKKLFGVSYEQLQGEREPNLNGLSLVYKRRYTRTIINITAAAEVLRNARKYEGEEKVILFVHGFTDDPTKGSFTNISDSFLDKAEISTIALDGSSLIRWLYLRSTTYVRFIGQKLGETLASLVYKGQDPSRIHIIGHSLGAHISGFAGKTFYNITGFKIGRISGLDPAGPCFSHVEEDCRLQASDADYVDIIHSDAGVYGIKDSVGHVDYYPNSGALQPNCLFQTCSHSRSWQLYARSVLAPRDFPAVRCGSWEAFRKGTCDGDISYMGYGSSGARGLYFLQTEGEYPYGLGMEGIKYKNTDGIVKNISNVIGKTSTDVISTGVQIQDALDVSNVKGLLDKNPVKNFKLHW